MTTVKPYGIEAAPRFNRDAKRLPPDLKRALDAEIRKIAADPYMGDRKRGVLRNVYVKKFKAGKDQWLIAYRIQQDQHVIQILAFGAYAKLSFERALEAISAAVKAAKLSPDVVDEAVRAARRLIKKCEARGVSRTT